MLKTTMKEARNQAHYTNLKELKDFLTKMSLTVKSIEKIAYTAGVYGCSGYLLRIETTTIIRNEIVNGHTIYAFTGRSSWMYNCDSLSLYNDSNKF